MSHLPPADHQGAQSPPPPAPCNRGVSVCVAVCRYVRRELRQEVDMRIGVHSGSVLGGILGLQKWQFDIWSWDVDIASSLEAAGVPGWDPKTL